MVRGRNHQCRAKLYRPASAPAHKPHRDHLGRRRPEGIETYHLPGPTREVCRLANVLKSHGVKKGDTVTIYLPMFPRRPMRCSLARGSARSIRSFRRFLRRISRRTHRGCRSKLLITADEGRRGGRKTPLKAHADEAVKKTAGIVETMLVVKHTGGAVGWVEGRDVCATTHWREPHPSALYPGCTRKTLCSSFIRRARPARRRAWCIQRRATSSTPR